MGDLPGPRLWENDQFRTDTLDEGGEKLTSSRVCPRLQQVLPSTRMLCQVCVIVSK